MKRIFTYLAIITCTLMGCSAESTNQTNDSEPTEFEIVNNLDGVTMTAKDETISSTGVTVALENSSNKQIIYGTSFYLEKKMNESWYNIPVIVGGEYGFADIGYELNASAVQEWNVEWEWLYGSLDSGEYRIVKDILDFRASGDYDKYLLAAEFTIK